MHIICNLCIFVHFMILIVFVIVCVFIVLLASKGSYFCIFSFSPSQEVCLLCASKEFN